MVENLAASKAVPMEYLSAVLMVEQKADRKADYLVEH